MIEDNVPGFPGYHVTRSGNVYSRRVERTHFIEGSYHKLLGLRISYYNI